MLTPSVAYATLTSKLAPRLRAALEPIIAKSGVVTRVYLMDLGLLEPSDGDEMFGVEQGAECRRIITEWCKQHG